MRQSLRTAPPPPPPRLDHVEPAAAEEAGGAVARRVHGQPDPHVPEHQGADRLHGGQSGERPARHRHRQEDEPLHREELLPDIIIRLSRPAAAAMAWLQCSDLSSLLPGLSPLSYILHRALPIGHPGRSNVNTLASGSGMDGQGHESQARATHASSWARGAEGKGQAVSQSV